MDTKDNMENLKVITTDDIKEAINQINKLKLLEVQNNGTYDVNRYTINYINKSEVLQILKNLLI
jgi:hypothetical protein